MESSCLTGFTPALLLPLPWLPTPARGWVTMCLGKLHPGSPFFCTRPYDWEAVACCSGELGIKFSIFHSENTTHCWTKGESLLAVAILQLISWVIEGNIVTDTGAGLIFLPVEGSDTHPHVHHFKVYSLHFLLTVLRCEFRAKQWTIKLSLLPWYLQDFHHNTSL